MKTKLTLREVVVSAKVLEQVANTKMPVRSSYRINKLLREILKEVDLYEDERKKIFEEYGEEEEGIIKIKKENEEVARESLEELLSQEVEVDLPNVDLETLEVGNVELSPLEMQAIEPLLLEDEEIPPGM